jgi:hypothetical protein
VYADDIFKIYDVSKLNMNDFVHTMDRFHTDLSFNPTLEIDGHIQFLDLPICKHTAIETDIFWKLTDKAIHYLSTHPTEIKLVAYCTLIFIQKHFPSRKNVSKKNGTPYSK